MSRNAITWLAALRWLAALTLSATLGCGGTESAAPSDLPGNPDQTVAGQLSVDEAGVRAHLDGAALTVSVPVAVKQALTASARVRLYRFDGSLVAEAITEGVSLAADGVIDVVLPPGVVPLGALEQAKLVVGYQVTAGDSVARGYKSLLYTLPQVDLRLRLPTHLDEGTRSQLRVLTLEPSTHAPAPNVPVSVSFGTSAATAVTTDETGSAVVALPAQASGMVPLSISAGDSGVLGALSGSVDIERSARVLVTSDKPMYQPGQVIHLRALALKRPENTAVADTDAVFEVRDGKGNLVFRSRGKTNAFGVASTDFKLASQVNVGNYRLSATVDGTITERTVTVKPYALPKFRVATTLAGPWAKVGSLVTGTVDAGYFFGRPVAGGTVTLLAGTDDVEFTTFATLDGTLDADGKWPFSLQLPAYLVGKPMENGNASVTLAITVTDTAGQSETQGLTLIVASAGLELLAVPESGKLEAGLENTIWLFATDPLGAPVDTVITATALGGTITVPVESVGPGVARMAVLPSVDLPLALTISANDLAGTPVTQVRGLGLVAGAGLLVRTDKPVYRAGETMTVTVVTTAAAGRAFVDVIRDGQTALTEAIDITAGVGTLALDLDAGLVGDLTVEAYRVAEDASIGRDRRIVYVKDARDLTISVAADKPQYRPGEAAVLTVSVKDEAGKGVTSAVGVQIVDEAVYALTDMKPGLAETFFRIQDALQKPSYEIHGAAFNLAGLLATSSPDAATTASTGAAFAALDAGDGVFGESSTWRDVTTALPGALGPAFSAALDPVRTALLALRSVDDSGIERADIDRIADQDRFDFWGQPIDAMVEERGWQFEVTFRSNGPDETPGTSDDLTATVLVNTYSAGPGADATMESDSAGPGEGGDGTDSGTGGEPTSGPRIRKDFPETLYWNPSLITGGDGTAEISLDMADSITQWRVSTTASTAAGALGSSTSGITVFQPFFVDVDFPSSLTRGDAVTFPVVVYNYLDTPQSVTLTVDAGDWFAATGSLTQTLSLSPGQVLGVSFPVKVLTVGLHALTVTAIGSTESDAVQRTVRVRPDGVEALQTKSGLLKGDFVQEMSWPSDLVPGSEQLLVKVYPGLMSQAVEGLDSMLREPTGCFEQTTASNWPNTLVLDYLRSTGQAAPEVEAKALGYLQEGYQRLLTYECTGGGFTWFGDPAPANVILSAMGVLEFADMGRVIEIDEDVVARTAGWVISAQQPDGHWTVDQGSEFATVQYDDKKTTAFVAWALGEYGKAPEAVGNALAWLAPSVANTADLYTLALAANAFAFGAPGDSRTTALIERLADAAVVGDDGSVSWTYTGTDMNYWQQDSGSGANPTSVEVTALAVQALITSGTHDDLVRGALAYLAGQKDTLGNYGSTHATILTLRALVHSLTNKTEVGAGTITVTLDGASVGTVLIDDDSRNVFHQFELAGQIDPATPSTVTVSYAGTGTLMAQVIWGGNVPLPAGGETSEVLDIAVAYDKTTLAVDDTVAATVTVSNLTDQQQDMVMVSVGVPPGFDVVTDALTEAIDAGELMKFERTGQQLVLYLLKLTPKQTAVFTYGLRAKYPVTAVAPEASTYLYYDTTTRAVTPGVGFSVQ